MHIKNFLLSQRRQVVKKYLNPDLPRTYVSNNQRKQNSPTLLLSQRENVSVWERYSWSIFRSTSQMLCIGYGENSPNGMIDLWVTYTSMVSGALCFALFIGHATALIQSMDISKRTYKEKVGLPLLLV